MLRQKAWLPIALFVFALVEPGCGRPKRVAAPEFDSEGATTQAISLYDTNSDGLLDEDELTASGALKNALAEIDTNSDGQLSKEEIRDRVDYFVQGRDGRISLMCRVLKGNTPVPGATVTFVPEPFMENMIEAAAGQTNPNGEAIINIDDQFGGIQPGFYKVEISRTSPSGKESIKKKFNEETILGQEVTSGSIALSQGLVFQVN